MKVRSDQGGEEQDQQEARGRRTSFPSAPRPWPRAPGRVRSRLRSPSPRFRLGAGPGQARGGRSGLSRFAALERPRRWTDDALDRCSSRACAAESLADLFAAEPDRLARLTVEECGIRFDFSKTHLEPAPCSTPSSRSPSQAGLAARRDALFAGEIVNPTEGRAAEHSAERGQGAPDSVARAAGAATRGCGR